MNIGSLSRDERALETLYRKYWRLVYSLAYSILLNPHDAEDVSQEVFLRAIQNLKRVKAKGFKRWLCITARNCAIDRIRERDRLLFVDIRGTAGDEVSPPLDQDVQRYLDVKAEEVYLMDVARGRFHDIVREGLAILSELDRQLVILHYFSSLPYSEIGRIIGVSASSVGIRLHRARKRLRKFFAKQGIDQGIREIMIRRFTRITPPRMAHRAIRLPNGRVLLVGGLRREDPISTVEPIMGAGIFDPETRRCGLVARMITPRLHSCEAVPFGDGRILIAGGQTAGTSHTERVEIFDPRSNRFERAGDLPVPLYGHRMTPLNDGTVLLTGGAEGAHRPALNIACLFDPETGRFITISPMNVPRMYHTATRLKDGRVLIAGGVPGTGEAWGEAYMSAEIFDPDTRRFTMIGSMNFPRAFHEAVLLKNGNVLVAGGSKSSLAFDGKWESAEVYDPKSGRFTPVGDMHQQRSDFTMSLLPSGRVVVIGGVKSDGGRYICLDGVELFDPLSNGFVQLPPLRFPRAFHTATVLDNGSVLVVGGSAARDDVALEEAEIISPEKFLSF